MATYFHGNPEIQAASASAEGLQTLVLMNPSYVQFSDTSSQQPNNLVFLNSAAANGAVSAVSHLPPASSTPHFVGIPLDPNAHDASALHGLLPRLHYNLYSPMDHSPSARDTPRAQQVLSLSLSSQQQPPPHPGYGSQGQMISAEDMRVSGGSVSSGSGVTNGVSGLQGVLLSSKYLKAAQDLLDEVVSVNNDRIKSELMSKKGNGIVGGPNIDKLAGETSGGDYSGNGDGEARGRRGPELTTAERQEIQMKKAKLIKMLEEVEQRYRQYHHQMHIIKASFEQAAGIGSANTYTALALATISKQFKCLKDTIIGQVKIANKSLGEEGKAEGSRLKYVDHHYRQQRALQQLGMMQHNAWRPQRGLPERSVSVLRAWLFEHFLHPYPKDSDKHMLAKQTGLTRSQVSNWFINARVRLWKPMVEEMYTEEIKENEKKNNNSEDKASRSELNDDATQRPEKCFKSFDNSLNQHINSTISMSMSSPVGGGLGNQSGFSLIGTSELEGITQASPKKQRSTEVLMQSPPGISPSTNMDIKRGDSSNDTMQMKFEDERHGRDGYSFFGGPNNFIGGFGQYPIGEIERFDADHHQHFAPRFSGNGVSLSLGLPNQDIMSLSGPHQNFLSNQNIQLGRRLDLDEQPQFGSIGTTAPHSTNAFDSIDNIQNRKRFAAQLLPTDFVA